MDSSTLFKVIVGSWFIIQTNLPLWLKGDKTNPTLNYTLIQRKGKEQLLDEVKYTKNGKQKTITGYNTMHPTNPRAFSWRGKGLLGLFTSRCEIRLIDPNGQWAVSWFSKTPFTPEGLILLVAPLPYPLLP
ncbi:MAG: hypothetical protein M0D57_03090 [Sphingobacteriales bacterium JAD_PAG50586_3]|nr:MAG: hypothetical protein M0D57_03090 [Sphingobacteriales bacterium JAD_PAG50586_3]